ncbi:MAG: EthD family reductase [Paracoccaceae bacterium]
MRLSVQVLYPTDGGTTFDHDYYAKTHMALVDKHMGAQIAEATITKGIASGSDAPAPYHAVATMVFADAASRDAALGAAGPVLADIPNFTNAAPQMLMGEIVE